MAVGAEKRRENTPHEELMAGNLNKVVPVRVPDYDEAAKGLRGRLGTTFVTDYDETAPGEETREIPRGGRRLNTTFVTDYDETAPREEEAPPVERLPEDLQKAAREGGRRAPAEERREEVGDYIVEGEARKKEGKRKKGDEGGDWSPY